MCLGMYCSHLKRTETKKLSYFRVNKPVVALRPYTKSQYQIGIKWNIIPLPSCEKLDKATAVATEFKKIILFLSVPVCGVNMQQL